MIDVHGVELIEFEILVEWGLSCMGVELHVG